MPFPGGATDKFGNRYEGLWTVDCMIDVMDEQANSIRLEPLGIEGEGVEFWINKDNLREYHQVKRQNTQGRWSISDLANKQILSNFYKKLNNSNSKCVFVSTDKAYQLDELTDRARRSSQSWQEFKRECLTSKNLKDSFFKLGDRWSDYSDKEIEEAIAATKAGKLSPSHLEIDRVARKVYELLQRVYVETESESRLRKTLETRLRALVEKDTNDLSFQDESATIVDILAQFALDRVHHELTSFDIWNHLKERGYRRREWGKDPHVLAAVEDCNNRYIDRLKDIAIADRIIPRDETEIILQKLNSPDQNISLLVTGEAGVGKSVVMLQVLEQLLEQGILVLSFRVDILNPVAHPDDVGRQLQLPASPAIVLASIAQKRKCVLVIDQLDTFSLTSGRHSEFFDCLHEVIQQAKSHPNIRLLIACRKFDLDNDHRLKNLTGENGVAECININRLSHEKVKEVVTELNLDATRLNQKKLDLLSVPLHLWLLSQIAQDTNINILNFQTAKDLFDRFWNDKQRELRKKLDRDIKWTQVIDLICDRMSSQQSLSVPKTIVDDFQADAEAMASEHILVKDNNRLRFFHDSFFDYAFARRFSARGQDLLSILRDSEQHLFRRNQVRQILIHERETDITLYLEHLKELLISDDIRFHIKQIVFAWLGTLDEPIEEEWKILSSILEGNNISLIQSTWG
ncbi:MAG: hypothetical protein ACRC2V_18890, partial [Xenococcaceae cyanobacterium]